MELALYEALRIVIVQSSFFKSLKKECEQYFLYQGFFPCLIYQRSLFMHKPNNHNKFPNDIVNNVNHFCKSTFTLRKKLNRIYLIHVIGYCKRRQYIAEINGKEDIRNSSSKQTSTHQRL